MKKNILNKTDIKKDESITKTIFSVIGKTLMAVMFILGFLVITISVVAPSVMAPTYEALGLDNATYLIYKRMYERENTQENLYNVIQLSIENEKYDDQVVFIKTMLEDEDFAEFSEKVDLKTKQVLGKRYSIYADSYESYLRKHIIVALYNTGQEMEAKMMAIDSVYGTVDELYVYVYMVVNDDKMIEIQKESELKTLYSRYGIIDGASGTDALSLKMQEIDEKLSLAESNYDSVIYLEQKIKLEEIRYNLAKYAKDTAMEATSKNNIENWNNTKSELLKILK